MRRILSIDGGGIKGTFPAAFLADVEGQVGAPIGRYFDLIAGTSTGGIIALGLGLGMSATDVLRFYDDQGPRIFEGGRRRLGLRWLAKTKHGPAALRRALEDALGDKTLAVSSTRLVIPSLNSETGDIYLYKTPHHPRIRFDGDRTAVDVALATAAAPTYLPTHWPMIGPPLIDGGLWANNPIAVAVTEGMGVLGWKPDEIEVLSIGCTSSPLHLGATRRRGFSGVVGWAPDVVDTIMKAQSDGALGIAKNLVGADSIHRYDPEVDRGRYALDDARAIRSLAGLGHHAARHAFSEIRHMFGETAVPFVPFGRAGE